MERFLTIPALDRCQGAHHLFGTRWVESPAAIAGHLGLAKEQTVTAHQIHGNAIRIIESLNATEGSDEAGHDALITGQTGLLIAIATADCVPVLIVDIAQRVIAAVHAGWRGTLKRIAKEVVTAMNSRFGSHARNLWVGLGPSAGPCCYEVDEVVLDPLKTEFPKWRSVIRKQAMEKPFWIFVLSTVSNWWRSGFPRNRSICWIPVRSVVLRSFIPIGGRVKKRGECSVGL